MSDEEAVQELAAALDHLHQAQQKAESEEVSELLLSSLDSLDETGSEVLSEIGKQHRTEEDC